MDYKWDTPLPLQAFTPKRSGWEVLKRTIPAAGAVLAYKARRAMYGARKYMTPVNAGLAAIGAGVARRYTGRSTRLVDGGADAGPAGRVLKYRRRRRGRRMGRFMRRRRVQRFRRFRRMLNSVMNPRQTYVINYTSKCDQTYNRKVFQLMDHIFSASTMGVLSAFWNNKVYANSDWFYYDKVRFQAQLYNASNSETYVTVYIVKCIDNNANTFIDWMTQDVIDGNISSSTTPVSTTNKIECDRADCLSQFQAWRKYYRIVKKKYFKMEGGGTCTFSFNKSMRRSVNPIIQGLASSNYLKGLSHSIILEVRSQIVKNTDASAGFCWDNASVGYGSVIKYTGGPILSMARRNASYNCSYVTASAPVVMTDVDNKTT